jgi:hypothetical protein
MSTKKIGASHRIIDVQTGKLEYNSKNKNRKSSASIGSLDQKNNIK